ncbi:ubiquitin-conjugating enzyme [Stylosanthes scabra]|uniref:Ubiquitin-conjugating enzyme n=1 Tax=Stylosanthes scabra TaxID=79078 RepID=A0ABU6SFY9_9FABA|nr:ubiquitin-conjugating enzyme [Stylosanthes scabra]
MYRRKFTTTLEVFGSTRTCITVAKYALVYLIPGPATRMRSGFQVFQQFCSGSANGETKSLRYNEDTFILSLRTMMYVMRRPPKHFENFAKGHFLSRAHDILVACKAYMEGAQVGCLVKGGVQDVDEGDKSCSKQFKESLTGYVNMIAKEFTRIGVEDCEKFLSPPKKQ